MAARVCLHCLPSTIMSHAFPSGGVGPQLVTPRGPTTSSALPRAVWLEHTSARPPGARSFNDIGRHTTHSHRLRSPRRRASCQVHDPPAGRAGACCASSMAVRHAAARRKTRRIQGRQRGGGRARAKAVMGQRQREQLARTPGARTHNGKRAPTKSQPNPTGALRRRRRRSTPSCGASSTSTSRG